ncbi:MAG: molybdopterin-binding protein, partial [Intestinibacter sp.]|uniref:TOBE domain-containing protein n=1 Tax=Intestinibacter sp. TaxID=1965304 RepID=UPI003F176B40
MNLSARNKLTGKVVELNKGAVNAVVKVELANKMVVTSTISLAAAEELGLEVGKEATAVVKATSVMISTNPQYISARNKLTGKIVAIEEGAVNSIVKLQLADDMVITATITLEAVKELGLEVGKEATAVVKATSVMIEDEKGLSARNQLAGKVVAINEGSVNAIVKLELASGSVVTSTITVEAVKALGLEVGKEATAIVKATSVMIG